MIGRQVIDDEDTQRFSAENQLTSESAKSANQKPIDQAVKKESS